MSKLDDILEDVYPHEVPDTKQQIKDLMLELIGDPEETDSNGRYNCIVEFRQKVNEL